MYYSLSVILDYPSLLYFWVLSPWVFLDSWLHLFPSFLAPFLIQCSKHARSSTLIIWSLFTKKYMCLALNFFSLWLTYWWGCDSHRPFFKLFQGLFSISKILSRVSSLSFLLIFFIHQHININFTISHFLGFTAHSYFYCVSFQSSFFKKKKWFVSSNYWNLTSVPTIALKQIIQRFPTTFYWVCSSGDFNLFLDLYNTGCSLMFYSYFLLLFYFHFYPYFSCQLQSLSFISSSMSLKEYMLQGSVVLSQYFLLLCSFCWIRSLLYILSDYFL